MQMPGVHQTKMILLFNLAVKMESRQMRGSPCPAQKTRLGEIDKQSEGESHEMKMTLTILHWLGN
jgi:hypothetical protein